MKRIIFIMLLFGIFLTFFAYAETETIYGSIPLDKTGDTKIDLPSVDGTGSRPNIGNEESFSLTMEDSVVPFANIQWGVSIDEVINITNGQLSDNQTEIKQEIVMPGINDPQNALYCFGDEGLESVSIIIETKKKAGSIAAHSDGNALIDIADKYFNTKDADEMMCFTGETLYCYKSIISDVAVGYIPNEKDYYFGISFNKPAEFDQSIFRNDSLYTMTTESNGTLDYNALSSRPVMLNIDEKYKIKVAFTSGVQMHGAGLTPINSIPRFRMVMVYMGLAEPKTVKTILFTIDNKLYQFTVPENYISGNKSDNGLYRYQYSLMMGRNNAEFMDALANTGKDVKVEMRGDNFNVSFPFIEKARIPVIEDWENFKKAGGLAPLYGLAADETQLTVY